MDLYVLALAVVSFLSLSISILHLLLQALDQISRSVTIRVFNSCSHALTGRSAYFHSGTSDVIPPDEVQQQGDLRYSARKSRGPRARGAVGVVTYDTDNGNTIAILFSVPFDYVLYTNWWNVKMYEGRRDADYAMYRELYYTADAMKGNDEWRDIGEENLTCGIRIRGVMSSSSNATLHVDLHNDQQLRPTSPGLLPSALTSLQLSSLSPGIQLGVTVLDDVLESFAAVVRSIGIGVLNKSGATWKAKNAYFLSGTSDVVLPGKIADGHTLLYSSRKTKGPVACGAVGVIAYDTSRGETLGILFSVPFDYNLFNNQWNVGLFPADTKADSEMYRALSRTRRLKSGNKMYETLGYSKLKKGDDCWSLKINIGNGYTASGVMSSSGTATLKIIVENPSGSQHLEYSIQ